LPDAGCPRALFAPRDKALYVGHTRDPNKPPDETFQMDEAAAELASAVLDMGEQAKRWVHILICLRCRRLL